MAIHFECQCGAKLKAADDKAGKTFQCPKCAQSVTVPAAAPAFEPPPLPTGIVVQDAVDADQQPPTAGEIADIAPSDLPNRRHPRPAPRRQRRPLSKNASLGFAVLFGFGLGASLLLLPRSHGAADLAAKYQAERAELSDLKLRYSEIKDKIAQQHADVESEVRHNAAMREIGYSALLEGAGSEYKRRKIEDKILDDRRKDAEGRLERAKARIASGDETPELSALAKEITAQTARVEATRKAMEAAWGHAK